MIQRFRVWNWRPDLVGVLTIAGVAGSAIALTASSAIAQSITLDGTLGPAETLRGPAYRIPQAAGQTVGTNLFHSFGRFGLNTGETARFESNAAIRTILSRVTGGSLSNIDGMISTSSRSVNLFLINPNGIVFGPNARLNVGGSFVATTARGLAWSNGEQFSAVNPEGADRLLTLVGDPSGFLATLQTPGAIENAGRLTVPAGQSLVLLGGDLTIGGVLTAPGGRVQLGAIAGDSQATLNIDNNALQVSFPNDSTGSNISANGARINVTSNAGGSIVMNARAIELTNTNLQIAGATQGGNATLDASDRVSLVNARITSDSFGAGNAGTTTIVANGDINLEGTIVTAIANETGNGGNITIQTNGNLRLVDESTLTAQTQGPGNAGNILMRANGAVLVDDGSISTASGALTGDRLGDAGDITIQAGTLTLTNETRLATTTTGAGEGGDIRFNVLDGALNIINSEVRTRSTEAGNAGSITINVADSVNISGVTPDSGLGGLYTSTSGSGRAGDITVTAGNAFRLSDRAVLDARTTGSGAGSNIRVRADTVEITNGGQILTTTLGSGNAGSIGVDGAIATLISGSAVIPVAQPSRAAAATSTSQVSGLFASTASQSTGAGGNIEISTDQLTVAESAQVTANSRGTGIAGDLNLTARNVRLNNQARLSAETATSRGGNIRLQIADSLVLRNRSQISAASTESGQGGNITVNQNQAAVRAVRLLDGSRLSAQAEGTSDAGSVNLNAQQITVQNRAQISASTTSGRGGDVTLQGLNSLRVNNGRIGASTQTGQAGSVTVAANQVQLSGRGGLSVAATQGGVAGNLTVTTGTLTVADRARVTVSSPSGLAGNLTISANEIDLDQGFLTAQTGVSRGDLGANISLQGLDQLILRNRSRISADAGDRANGGNLAIDSRFVVAIPNENSDIRANAVEGRGGTIVIETQGLFGIAPATEPIPGISDITASSERGVQGVVQIKSPEVDPSQGLTELPVDVVDAASLIARSCANGSGIAAPERSEFVMTGRGGVPISPGDALNRDAVITNWVTLNPQPRQTRVSASAEDAAIADESPASRSTALRTIEAQGWVVGANGEVSLTAQAPTVTSSHPAFASARCAQN